MSTNSRSSGAHDPRLDRILAEYIESVESGSPQNPEDWAARYPEFAAELCDFIAVRRQFDAAVQNATDDLPHSAIDTPTLLGQGDVRDGSVASTSAPRVRYFGDYELLEEIARGGMGVVYKARQSTLKRIVALKMILSGQLAGEEAVARFYSEAEAAAKLDHPNIVPIFEIGQNEGQHYFSMALVEGESLARKAAAGPLPPREAAQVMKKVADAIAYAHVEGVIHRDLKPANVLLDRDGEPRVTDFGLAKHASANSLTPDAGKSAANLTVTGQVLGTPGYMPPEQAAGKTDEVSTLSDVYSLGALLYCLLTGRPPFQAANPLDTLLQVLHKEPVSVRQLNPEVPRDLETICLKCLEKDPHRRYATAAEYAADLQRYLHGEPVKARPIGKLTRGWRWCRRRPAASGFLVASSIAALALVGVITGLRYSIRLERALAEKTEAQRQAATYHYFHRIGLAHAQWKDGTVGRVVQLLEECPAELRAWEWHYLNRLCNSERLTIRGFGEFTSVAIHPDGSRLALVSNNSKDTVKIYDASTGRESLTFKGLVQGGSCARFNPQGTQLAMALWDNSIKVWDTTTGLQRLNLTEHTGETFAVAFNHDGSRLASASYDQTVKVWDATTGLCLFTLAGHTNPVQAVAFSPDGTQLASASWDGTVRVWNPSDGTIQFVITRLGGAVYSITFSPDGKQIASGGYGGTVKLWNAKTGEESASLVGHTSSVHAVAYSADGTRLATAGDDELVKIWDTSTAQERLTLKGHRAAIKGVTFSPDGSRVISASQDQTARVWNLDSPQEARILAGHPQGVRSVNMSPSDERLACGYEDGMIEIRSASSESERLSMKRHTGPVTSLAFSSDGTRLASVSDDQTMRMWNAKTGGQLFEQKAHTAIVTRVVFSPNDKRLATASWDHTIKIWDAETGETVRVLEGHKQPVWDVAFSPDGTVVASGGWDGVKIWDVQTGTKTMMIEGGVIRSLAFSPYGKLLATGNESSRIELWNVATGESVRQLSAHVRRLIYRLQFTPDGTRLISAGSDGTASVWDVATGLETLTLKGHTDRVWDLSLNRDGTRLASASADQTVRIWDARPLPE